MTSGSDWLLTYITFDNTLDDPAKTMFRLKSNGFGSKGDFNMAIIDIQGRLTTSITFSNLNDELDISGLEEGIYTVSL